ncbi:hypothetical protein ACJZ2D_016093 [Fusarium nematophilum]
MEPASVIGIVAFGLHVSRRLFDIYDSARNAGSDVVALCDSASALSTSLAAVSTTLANARDSDRLVELAREGIEACEGGLRRLDKKLDKINRLSSEPTNLHLRLRLRYAFQEKTIAKMRETVDGQLLGGLRLVLLTLNLNVAIATQNSLAATEAAGLDDEGNLRQTPKLSFEKLGSGINNIADVLDNLRLWEQRDHIINWVSSGDNVSHFHNSVCDHRQINTGNWFLQGDTYARWKTSPNSFLWLHGIPGCGKTVLCSSIIKETVSFCSLRDNHFLSFFYFSFSDTERQSTDAFARSVLRQLLLQRESLPDAIVDVYRRYSHSCPTLGTWKSALKGTIQASKETYILVDALDECPSLLGERKKLLDFIKGLTDLELPNLHIIATSRKEQDVERALSRLGTCPPLSIQTSVVDEDIQSYVRSEISQDDVMSRWPTALQEEVHRELGSRANGMFRWASCQLEELRKCLRPAAVRRTLALLPATLDETYARILQSISIQHHEEAINALVWLICSKRPLSLKELAEAIIINLDDGGSIDMTERLFDDSFILVVLSSLVTTSGGQIRLAHFSVEEYLTSDRLAQSSLANFRVSIPARQPMLLRACLSYIHADAARLEGEGKLKKAAYQPTSWIKKRYLMGEASPLLPYAAKFWIMHFNSCNFALPADTVDAVINFLQPGSELWLWELIFFDSKSADKRLHSRFGEQGDGLSRAPNAALYYAARFGFDAVVKELLVSSDVGADFAGDKYGDELRVACYFGRTSTVKLLLDGGADAAAENSKHMTPLRAAVEGIEPNNTSPELLTMLVNRLELKRQMTVGTLLLWASKKGHLTLVARVLEKLEPLPDHDFTWCWRSEGRDWHHEAIPPYASYRHYCSPAYEAAAEGQAAVLRLMLDLWGYVDERDSEGRTALYWAAFRGYEHVVRMLIDAGADPEPSMPSYAWTPRYWALDKSYHAIVGMLDEAIRIRQRH